MSKVYDPSTGRVTDEAAAPTPQPGDAGQALGIPSHVVQSGKIPMLTESGEPVYVKPEELSDAQALGYRYESPQEESARHERATFGGTGGMAAAGVAAAARAGTLGLSDVAAKGVDSLLGSDLSGDLKKLQKYNPYTSTAGEVGGTIASTLIPAGPLARVAGATGKLLGVGAEGASAASQIVRHAASEAVQGAVQGAGVAASDRALGNTDDLAEALIQNAGLGALIGGGGSLGIAGVAGTVKAGTKGAQSAMRLLRGEEKAALPEAVGSAAHEFGTPVGAQPLDGIEPGALPESLPGGAVSPTGLEAPGVAKARASDPVQRMVDKAEEMEKYGGGLEAMPRQEVQRGILERNPELRTPELDPITDSMFQSPAEFDHWRGLIQGMPSRERKALDVYLQQAEKKANAVIADQIDGLGTGERLLPEQSGQRLVESARKQYTAEKEATKGLFKEFEGTKFPETYLGDLAEKLSESGGIGARIYRTAEGELKLHPWDATSGVTKDAYNAVSESLSALNKGDLNLKGFQNIRETLRQTAVTNPGTSRAIDPVRKALLSHVEKLVELNNPGMPVREAFTRWAKNEAFKEGIEDILGGALTPMRGEAGIASEKVISRALSSSQQAMALKSLVGEGEFNNLVGDHLFHTFQKSFDTAKGKLSAPKMRAELGRQLPILRQVADEKVLQKLTDSLDYLKNTSQLELLNPSGTAKTLWLLGGFKEAAKKISSPGEALSALGHGLEDSIQKRKAVTYLREVLDGKRTSVAEFNKTNTAITDGLKSFFEKNKGNLRKAVLPTAIALSLNSDQYKKRYQEIANLVEDPEALVNRVSQSTKNVGGIDPKLQDSVVKKTIQAAQFLYSKAPKPPMMLPLDSQKKWRPTDSDIAKWNRYARAVQNPTGIIRDMSAGTLTAEGVEAVKSVYPEIYQKISQTALSMAAGKEDKISYRDKLMLSLLLGQPLTRSLNPQSIQMLQSGPSEVQNEGAPQGGAGKPSSNRKPSFDASTRSMTGTQKLLTR
jgi:hypothetical protein